MEEFKIITIENDESLDISIDKENEDLNSFIKKRGLSGRVVFMSFDGNMFRFTINEKNNTYSIELISAYRDEYGEPDYLEERSCPMVTKSIPCNVVLNSTFIEEKNNCIESIMAMLDKDFMKILKKVTDGKGSIYIITDGADSKIGCTSGSVRKRLLELQTGNKLLLEIVGSYKTSYKNSTEALLHAKYAEKRIRGEWFTLSSEDINSILAEKISSKNIQKFNIVENKDLGRFKLNSADVALSVLNQSKHLLNNDELNCSLGYPFHPELRE